MSDNGQNNEYLEHIVFSLDLVSKLAEMKTGTESSVLPTDPNYNQYLVGIKTKDTSYNGHIIFPVDISYSGFNLQTALNQQTPTNHNDYILFFAPLLKPDENRESVKILNTYNINPDIMFVNDGMEEHEKNDTGILLPSCYEKNKQEKYEEKVKYKIVTSKEELSDKERKLHDELVGTTYSK